MRSFLTFFLVCSFAVALSACHDGAADVALNSLSPAGQYAVSTAGSNGLTLSQSTSMVGSGATFSTTVTADNGYAPSPYVGGTCPVGSWSGNTYTTGTISSVCSVSFSKNRSVTLPFVSGTSDQVDMTNLFNTTGITTDGSVYSHGGFDEAGDSFSGSCLTSFRSNFVDFKIAGPDVPSVYQDALPAVVNVPQGNYQTLILIGAAINGAQHDQPIVISYATGDKTYLTQSFSDWQTTLNFPNETPAKECSLRNTADGNQNFGSYTVYSYQILLDRSRTLTSIQFPPNPAVRFLAMNLGDTFSASSRDKVSKMKVAKFLAPKMCVKKS